MEEQRSEGPGGGQWNISLPQNFSLDSEQNAQQRNTSPFQKDLASSYVRTNSPFTTDQSTIANLSECTTPETETSLTPDSFVLSPIQHNPQSIGSTSKNQDNGGSHTKGNTSSEPDYESEARSDPVQDQTHATNIVPEGVQSPDVSLQQSSTTAQDYADQTFHEEISAQELANLLGVEISNANSVSQVSESMGEESRPRCLTRLEQIDRLVRPDAPVSKPRGPYPESCGRRMIHRILETGSLSLQGPCAPFKIVLFDECPSYRQELELQWVNTDRGREQRLVSAPMKKYQPHTVCSNTQQYRWSEGDVTQGTVVISTRKYPDHWTGGQRDFYGNAIPEYNIPKRVIDTPCWRYSVIVRAEVEEDVFNWEFRILPKIMVIRGVPREVEPEWLDVINKLRDIASIWEDCWGTHSLRPLTVEDQIAGGSLGQDHTASREHEYQAERRPDSSSIPSIPLGGHEAPNSIKFLRSPITEEKEASPKTSQSSRSNDKKEQTTTQHPNHTGTSNLAPITVLPPSNAPAVERLHQFQVDNPLFTRSADGTVGYAQTPLQPRSSGVLSSNYPVHEIRRYASPTQDSLGLQALADRARGHTTAQQEGTGSKIGEKRRRKNSDSPKKRQRGNNAGGSSAGTSVVQPSINEHTGRQRGAQIHPDQRNQSEQRNSGHSTQAHYGLLPRQPMNLATQQVLNNSFRNPLHPGAQFSNVASPVRSDHRNFVGYPPVGQGYHQPSTSMYDSFNTPSGLSFSGMNTNSHTQPPSYPQRAGMGHSQELMGQYQPQQQYPQCYPGMHPHYLAQLQSPFPFEVPISLGFTTQSHGQNQYSGLDITPTMQQHSMQGMRQPNILAPQRHNNSVQGRRPGGRVDLDVARRMPTTLLTDSPMDPALLSNSLYSSPYSLNLQNDNSLGAGLEQSAFPTLPQLNASRSHQFEDSNGYSSDTQYSSPPSASFNPYSPL